MKVKTCRVLMSAVAFAVVSVNGFAAEDSATASDAKPSRTLPITSAMAVLEPMKGYYVSGTITFEKQERGVYVVTHVNGLVPGSYHGVYLLATGDCNAREASSADDRAHNSKGGSNLVKRYLGYVVGDAYGNGQDGFLTKKITLDGTNAIIGRAVAVYERNLGPGVVPRNAGALTTEPGGDSGARMGCGVVKAPGQ
jgi:Cu-Zn family superoxide dismutase